MHTETDIILAERVKNAVEHQVHEHGDIVVTAESGMVSLSGIVESEASRTMAINAARSVHGVMSVNDQLHIKGSATQSMGEYVDDALITTTAKAKLLAETGLASLSISVETNQGVVTLTGSVDKLTHATQAEQVVKMINGVKRVDNKLIYKP